eukprot:CAMPEP_0204630398 /NCGR_PEP_ID=MMETSP0717-20131115/20338_1 /ASSEMBLY_ACC=CAM_ASM_000666 /TAXON_ID=230516 /ORGANISM="Chaetoceros curvisetus" /LENGTH=53 /DNA_ID=CAMNT_0051647617 /DNA_START=61 /DNA_END=218 /DNA_ORIENTATION=-
MAPSSMTGSITSIRSQSIIGLFDNGCLFLALRIFPVVFTPSPVTQLKGMATLG